MEAPLLGVGIRTARILALRDDENPTFAPGVPFRISTSVHSHNAFLQIWFETGLLGAVLLCSIGLLTLRVSSLAPLRLQPALYATFASAATVSSSSFSIWAPWFISAFGIAAIFAIALTALGTSARTDERIDG
jgi:O-antigen ligase